LFLRKYCFILIIYTLFTSCSLDWLNINKNNNAEMGTVYFHNESSFKVNLFMNFNPEKFDPTTFLTSIDPNLPPQSMKLHPSFSQTRGDTFYPHYLLQLENRIETETIDIYAAAERPYVYISLVIESGKTYNNPPVKIPQPKAGELKPLHGYIIVNNLTSRQVQIINGSTPLRSIHNSSDFIDALKKGYYEIEFPYFFNNLTINSLRAYSSIDLSFPSFRMERGKKYYFNIKDNNVEAREKDPVLDILPIGLK